MLLRDRCGCIPTFGVAGVGGEAGVRESVCLCAAGGVDVDDESAVVSESNNLDGPLGEFSRRVAKKAEAVPRAEAAAAA